MEATICQRRFLFAGALARQGDERRLPKRLLFAGRLEGGEDPGLGQSAQHLQKSLRNDFKAFEALHGSTPPTDRRTFGVDRLVWTDAARKEKGMPWYTGVLLGAERCMASWHKGQEEASRLREVNRAAKDWCTIICCLDLPPLGASLLMNGFDLTACLELNRLLFYPVSFQW